MRANYLQASDDTAARASVGVQHLMDVRRAYLGVFMRHSIWTMSCQMINIIVTAPRDRIIPSFSAHV